MKKYDIIFDGDVKPDFDPAEVRRNLISLLDLGEESLESLLSGGPIVIKENVEQQTALHFREAFENAGAECRIRPAGEGGPAAGSIQKGVVTRPGIETPRDAPLSDAPEKKSPPETGRAVSPGAPGDKTPDEDDSPGAPMAPAEGGKSGVFLGVFSMLICIPPAVIAGLSWIPRFPRLHQDLGALAAWAPPVQGSFLLMLGAAGIILCVAGIVCGAGGLLRGDGKKLFPLLGVALNSLVSLCIVAAIFYVDAPTRPAPKTVRETPSTKAETPRPVEAHTQRAFYVEKFSWTQRHINQAWNKNDSKKTKCMEPVNQFIDDAFRFLHGLPDKPASRDLLNKGEALGEGGCKHPLAYLWHGMVLRAMGDSIGAEPFARKAFVGIQRGNYPKIHSFLAARLMTDIAREAEGKNGKSFEKWKSRMGEAMAAAIASGEFSKGEARIAWHLMEGAGASFDFGECFKKLKKKKDVDPWLLLMLEGESEIVAAWDARGRDRAYTVTKEGWKAFFEHLNRASDALTRAWTLQPEAPEAPTRMITVAMSRGDKTGKAMRLWFDRAVEAQADFTPAYDKYLTSLEPRWGGSFKKMHDFGLECLDGARFDTDIPLFYLKTLRETGKMIEYSRWFAPFRDPLVEENLHRLFEGLLEAPERAADQGRIRTCQALIQAWSGNYETAVSILEELGEEAEFAPGFLGDPLLWNGRDLEFVETELRAFTGPLKKRLKMAESLGLFEKVDASLSLLEEMMAESREDAPLFLYLRERIALSRMGVRPEKLEGGNTAVHLAARGSHIGVMRFLLKNGEKVSRGNGVGDAPLHQAARKGRERMVSFLLEMKADLNARNHAGWTPLHQALAYKKSRSARLLIKNGANVNAANNEGASPLHFALGYNLGDVAMEMIEISPDVNVKDKKKDAPLHVALRGEETAAARMLVERGADVNVKNNRGNSPLHIAVTLKLTDMVRFLLESGARVNLVNGENWPPLHLAIYYDAMEITGILLAHGADIHQRLADGWTPLHLAVEYGRIEIMELLLEKGSDCMARLSDGRTPLLIAREKGAPDLVGALNRYIRDSGREDEMQRLHQKIKASREWVDKGFLEIKAKQPRIALEHFKRAEAEDPDFVMGLYGMGLAYSELDEKLAAFKFFRKAIEVDPHHASPYVDWGSALMISGKIKRGIRLYKMATDVDPKNAPANMTLFNYYINEKKCRRAVRHFKRIPEDIPDWPSFREKLNRYCPDSL
ncbi:MAG: hypothetical protein GY859_25395 [Desulfobacterales bacterium]|nr:hypothetical protein [Desulfobacterales bacterium]